MARPHPAHAPHLVLGVSPRKSRGSALCVGRLIPAPKPVDRSITLDEFKGTLTERGDQVLLAIAAGKISPSKGNALLSALSAQARLVESQELEERLAALEETIAENSTGA